MKTYSYFPGTKPIIVSMPHVGTYIPESILEKLTPSAKQLKDTDWHLEKLYSFVEELGAHVLMATHSRYVIDLNRAPDGQSLYPGQFTTELCPLTEFDGTPLYIKGMQPDAEELQARITTYWQPYHDQLQAIIHAVTSKHTKVVVFDAHSICSQVPMLFEGILPDLNIGTADGTSMQPELAEKVIAYCKQSPYSMVYNGRFKGGYITRHYGKPSQGINSIQLELAQVNYMQEAYPFTYDAAKAHQLQHTLRGILNSLG